MDSTLSHPAVAEHFASNRNSASGTVNSAFPHSKQTISSGNTQAVGLSMFFSPGERMPISAMNLVVLNDPHLHGKGHPLFVLPFGLADRPKILSAPVPHRNKRLQ